MIHSFLVTMVGGESPDAGAIDVMLNAWEDLIASVGGAGARPAGEPAEEGFDTAGDAMIGLAR